MNTIRKAGSKKLILRLLMVVPPILFIAYAVHGIVMVRGLLGMSVDFHLTYANELVQDFIALEIALEIQMLENQLMKDPEAVHQLNFVTTEAGGAKLGDLALDGSQYGVYIHEAALAKVLPDFFMASKGLSSLFTERYHEPVYWFRIINSQGSEVFRSGNKPSGKEIMGTYPMERTLKGHEIQIIYNSFGPSQLYSVARTKINFASLLLLFVLAIFSAVLLTHSIRQKIVLARQKTHFVSTVSHEFKTPLAIMKLATETLAARRFKTPEDEQRFRNMLTTEINRLDHLVHKILSFNKIEMGQIQYHPSRIDLRDALSPTLTIFQAQALADKVTLEIDLDEQPCIIDGDADLIRHGVDNILDNAFKYRGKSDLISFSCKNRGDTVDVAVTDYGIGIPESEIPHIQKSFYRVHDSALQGVRGSGLGLSVTRNILKMAGGALHIESEHGKGSTFTISFPARKDT